MDILSYLAEVIQTNKEVGVPELGTFFKKKSPGRYDAEIHSFIPPSYQLQFSPEVTEETLLSEYISKHHNLSEESAIYHIDQFVANIKERLTDDKEVNLNALGKLVLAEGELKFSPNPELNLGYKFYGLPETAEELPSIEKPVEVKEETPVPLIEETPVPEPVETPAPPVEEAPVPEEKESLEAIIAENNLEEENPGNIPEEPIYIQEPELAPEETEEPTVSPVNTAQPAPQTFNAANVNEEPVNYQIEEQVKRVVPTYLKVIIGILALLSLILALFLLNPNWFGNLTQKQDPVQKSTVPAPSVAPMPVDTLSGSDTVKTDTLKQEILPANTVQKDTISAKTPAAKTPVVLPKGTTFEIIGSSVYSQKEADQFISFMKRKWGITAKVVSQRPGKKIKISIATYKDEKTARAERARLEDKINIPGLYIYTNTHKQE